MGTTATPQPSLTTAQHFAINWKTTACGLAGAVIVAIQTYNGNGGWKGYVGAALIAVTGALMKDFNA